MSLERSGSQYGIYKNSDWSEYRNFCQKMIADIRKSLGITNAYSLSLPNEIFTIYFTNLLKMN